MAQGSHTTRLSASAKQRVKGAKADVENSYQALANTDQYPFDIPCASKDHVDRKDGAIADHQSAEE